MSSSASVILYKSERILLVNIDRWVSSVFLSSCNGVPLIALVYLFFYVLSAIRS
jgi:ABC-type amino acid transport system permease subunit